MPHLEEPGKPETPKQLSSGWALKQKSPKDFKKKKEKKRKKQKDYMQKKFQVGMECGKKCRNCQRHAKSKR